MSHAHAHRRLAIVALAAVSVVYGAAHLVLAPAPPPERLTAPERRNVAATLLNARLDAATLAALRGTLQGMPRGDVLFSYGNRDHLPFHMHWVCNTMGWPGVHERTVIAVADTHSQATLRNLSSRVHTVVVPELARSHGFFSKGYRLLTIRRVVVLVAILASGRGVVMFEGDALWTANVLDDANVAGPDRRHDVALYRDGHWGTRIGAGFMSMKGNRSGAYTLWSLVLERLHADMAPFAREPDAAVVAAPLHEQAVLSDQVLPALVANGTVSVFSLDRCVYTSGLWYKRWWRYTHVWRCGPQAPALLNNNWLAGNAAKVRRATLAGHWFLDGAKCADWNATLRRATGAATSRGWL